MSKKEKINGAILRVHIQNYKLGNPELLPPPSKEVVDRAEDSINFIIDSFRAHIKKQSILFVKIFGGSRSQIEDCECAGIVALIKSVDAINTEEKYDGAIVLYLKQYSKIYIRRLAAKICSATKIPDSVSNKLVRINKLREKYAQQGKLAEFHQIPKEEILKAAKYKRKGPQDLEYGATTVMKNVKYIMSQNLQFTQKSLNDDEESADKLMSAFDPSGMSQFNSPSKQLLNTEARSILTESLEGLSDIEQELLNARYLEHETNAKRLSMTQMSERFNIPKKELNKIEKKALKKLKAVLQSHEFTY